jgi:hypothetical protein
VDSVMDQLIPSKGRINKMALVCHHTVAPLLMGFFPNRKGPTG